MHVVPTWRAHVVSRECAWRCERVLHDFTIVLHAIHGMCPTVFRMIQSESWINLSTSLHCAGFIKLVWVHQDNGRGLSVYLGTRSSNCIPHRNPREIYHMKTMNIRSLLKMVDKSHDHKCAIYCMSPRVLAGAGHKFVYRAQSDTWYPTVSTIIVIHSAIK